MVANKIVTANEGINVRNLEDFTMNLNMVENAITTAISAGNLAQVPNDDEDNESFMGIRVRNLDCIAMDLNMLQNVQPNAIPRAVSADLPPVPNGGEDIESVKGRFEWKNIWGNFLPFITRVINCKRLQFVSVQMAETELLVNYLKKLNKNIYKCTSIRAYTITDAEANLLNDLNENHADQMYGKEKFQSDKHCVVSVEDVQEYYAFVEICFNKLVGNILPGLREKCGFIQIDHLSVVPYCCFLDEEQKYLPLFFFECYAEKLISRAVRMDNWDLAYLKFCCLLQGITIEDYIGDSCLVARLDDIQNFLPSGTVFEDYFPPKDIMQKFIKSESMERFTSGEWVRMPPSVLETAVVTSDIVLPPLPPPTTVLPVVPLPPIISLPTIIHTEEQQQQQNQRQQEEQQEQENKNQEKQQEQEQQQLLHLEQNMELEKQLKLQKQKKLELQKQQEQLKLKWQQKQQELKQQKILQRKQMQNQKKQQKLLQRQQMQQQQKQQKLFQRKQKQYQKKQQKLLQLQQKQQQKKQKKLLKRQQKQQLMLQHQEEPEQQLLLQHHKEQEQQLLMQIQKEHEQQMVLQHQKEQGQQMVLQQLKEQEQQLLLQLQKEHEQQMVLQQQKEQEQQLVLQQLKEQEQQLFLWRQKEQEKQLVLQHQKEQEQQLLLQHQKEQEQQLLLQFQKEHEQQMVLQHKKEQEQQLVLQQLKEQEQQLLLWRQKEQEQLLVLQQQWQREQQQNISPCCCPTVSAQPVITLSPEVSLMPNNSYQSKRNTNQMVNNPIHGSQTENPRAYDVLMSQYRQIQEFFDSQHANNSPVQHHQRQQQEQPQRMPVVLPVASSQPAIALPPNETLLPNSLYHNGQRNLMGIHDQHIANSTNNSMPPFYNTMAYNNSRQQHFASQPANLSQVQHQQQQQEQQQRMSPYTLPMASSQPVNGLMPYVPFGPNNLSHNQQTTNPMDFRSQPQFIGSQFISSEQRRQWRQNIFKQCTFSKEWHSTHSTPGSFSSAYLPNTQQQNALRNNTAIATSSVSNIPDLSTIPPSHVPQKRIKLTHPQHNDHCNYFGLCIQKFPERADKHIKHLGPAYKIQRSSLKGKIISTINAEPFVYSDLMVTLDDLILTLRLRCDVLKCATLINQYLSVDLYMANSEQVEMLRMHQSLKTNYTLMVRLADITGKVMQVVALIKDPDSFIRFQLDRQQANRRSTSQELAAHSESPPDCQRQPVAGEVVTGSHVSATATNMNSTTNDNNDWLNAASVPSVRQLLQNHCLNRSSWSMPPPPPQS